MTITGTISGLVPWARKALLCETEVGDVWGIGRRCARKLSGRGVWTAFDLACAPDGWVRKNLGVVGHRTVLELRGLSCLELETAPPPPPRQTVRHSRTFSRAVRDPDQLRAAVASFASSAAAKVRSYGLEAGAVQVFVTSNRFASSGPRHSGSGSERFPEPTSDGREVVRAALRILESVRREGMAYRKAGTMLLDLSDPEERTPGAVRAGGVRRGSADGGRGPGQRTVRPELRTGLDFERGVLVEDHMIYLESLDSETTP